MSEDAAITRVEVCYFKPMGYSETVYVRTDNRGAAARHVMDKIDKRSRISEFDKGPLFCLNAIETSLCAEPDGKKHQRPHIVEDLDPPEKSRLTRGYE